MSTLKYPPGSSEAEAQGCICSPTLNRHGKGTLHGQPRFYVHPKCPVHQVEAEQQAHERGDVWVIRSPRVMTKMSQPGAEPANVFEDRQTPGQWRVEWFDDDGRCELEIFTGHDARRQALRYAMRKYGHFKEVQSEEQSEAPRLP